MEQKIDGLVALLAQPDMTRVPSTIREDSYTVLSPTNSTFRAEPRHNSSPSATNNHKIQDRDHGDGSAYQSLPLSSQPGFTHQESYVRGSADPKQQQMPNPASRSTIPHEIASDHALAKDLIPPPHADFLLNEFRKMTDYFPFVVIPMDSTVHEMESERPMLLLAVFMTASGSDRGLQVALENRFRRELAEKTIISAQRSLDCLQSILIYVAWYHFHFHPQAQQIYQLLNLAVSMAVGLGISHKPRRPVIEFSSHNEDNSRTPSKQREAQRTFLGCYYLSSVLSNSLSTPNLLKHSEYMTECCNRLKEDREFVSDSVLLHMIDLQHIGDQVYAAFRLEGTENLHADQARLRMHIELLQSCLKDWKGRMPTETAQQSAMELSYEYNRTELLNVGTRMAPTSVNHNHSPNTLSTKTYQFDLLLSCLEAGKAYLDTILGVPPAQYRLFSFVEWMRLPITLLMISYLSFPNEKWATTSWNILTAQEHIRLDLYLESLCYRMQSLTTYNGTTQPQPDIFSALKLILERTRAWYTRKTRGPAGETSEADPVDESPLEVMRDPHGPDSNGAGTQHNSPDEASDGTLRVIAPMNEVQEASQINYADMTDFPELDGFMDNLDDTFWTSNLFDPAMLSET